MKTGTFSISTLRTATFDMSIDLESLRYAINAGDCMDVEMTVEQRKELAAKFKAVEELIDSLRADLFALARA